MRLPFSSNTKTRSRCYARRLGWRTCVWTSRSICALTGRACSCSLTTFHQHSCLVPVRSGSGLKSQCTPWISKNSYEPGEKSGPDLVRAHRGGEVERVAPTGVDTSLAGQRLHRLAAPSVQSARTQGASMVARSMLWEIHPVLALQWAL